MSGVPGQGRKFDREHVLEVAMLSFWRHGFEGTSITDLRVSTGLTASSMYAAFGNKEDLFRATLEHYRVTRGEFMDEALKAHDDAPSRLSELLFAAAFQYAGGKDPGGCYIINTANCVADDNAGVADLARSLREQSLRSLEGIVIDGVADGTLPKHMPPIETAGFIAAVLQGMAQRGFDGASHDELRATAEMTLNAIGLAMPANPELLGASQ